MTWRGGVVVSCCRFRCCCCCCGGCCEKATTDVAVYLQVVGVGNVPLHGVTDGVWAGEEVVARLLLIGTAVGIHVLVQEFPHVVGKVQNLEVLGVGESSLELLGNGSVVLWLPHDLADQPLLAVQIVVVELLIDILEHGDPLDNVHAIEESVLGRSILTILSFSVWVIVLIVVSVVKGTLADGATHDKGTKNSGCGQENNSTEKDDAACGSCRVKVYRSALIVRLSFKFLGIRLSSQTEEHNG